MKRDLEEAEGGRESALGWRRGQGEEGGLDEERLAGRGAWRRRIQMQQRQEAGWTGLKRMKKQHGQ